MHIEETEAPGGRARRLLASPWLRPLNDGRALDDLLRPLDFNIAFTELRARLKARRAETADACTLVLQANNLWRGFIAGQSVGVVAEIDGRLHRRRYSLISDPADRGEIAFTVKRQPGGRVSGWLQQELRIGERLRLEPPEGDFVLPEVLPRRILMLSAGSGITPMISLLKALQGRSGAVNTVDFIHVCRSREDFIFGDSLERTASQWPALRLHPHYTRDSGRPDFRNLLAAVPDPANCLSFVCGPEGLMSPLREYWAGLEHAAPLRFERYGVTARPVGAGEPATVSCEGSSCQFSLDSGRPLLEAAEQAGLSPRHGCRRGICHSCRYRKRSGTVENLLTGEISSEPDQMVQLCVCTPRSDLVFEDL